jgi:cytosine/adenosine deaminase-related metal-dependent hydrolase
LTSVYNLVGTGINMGLSTDNLTGASNASILDQARSLTITMHGVSGDGFTYQHKSAIKAATLNGAKALNMDSEIGSLTPGKQADLILVRTNSLTMTNAETLNPYRLLFGAQIGDVDTVMVGGRIVKQNGTMIGVNVDQALRSLAASLARMRAAGNWPTVPY